LDSVEKFIFRKVSFGEKQVAAVRNFSDGGVSGKEFGGY